MRPTSWTDQKNVSRNVIDRSIYLNEIMPLCWMIHQEGDDVFDPGKPLRFSKDRVYRLLQSLPGPWNAGRGT